MVAGALLVATNERDMVAVNRENEGGEGGEGRERGKGEEGEVGRLLASGGAVDGDSKVGGERFSTGVRKKGVVKFV